MATYITIPNVTPEAEETLLQPPKKILPKLNRLTGVAAASFVLAMLVAAAALTSSAGASSPALGEKASSPALGQNNCPAPSPVSPGHCRGTPYTVSHLNDHHYIHN